MIIDSWYSFHNLPLSGRVSLALPVLFVLIPITEGLVNDNFKHHCYDLI